MFPITLANGTFNYMIFQCKENGSFGVTKFLNKTIFNANEYDYDLFFDVVYMMKMKATFSLSMKIYDSIIYAFDENTLTIALCFN